MVIPEQGRLFSTGCSFTDFVWPTYIDFLSSDFKETISCGRPGVGNEYIFHSAMQMLQEYKPTSKDLVIVQWTGVTRVDYIFNGNKEYTSVGQLGNQEHFDDEWVHTYFNLVQHSFNLYNYILGIYYTAKNLGTNIVFLNMFDPWVDDMYGEPYSIHHIFKKYEDYIKTYYPFEKLKTLCNNLNFLQSLEEFTWSKKESATHYIWYKDKKQFKKDNHPSPLVHHNYAKYINDTLNLNCKNIFKEEVESYRKKISSIFQDSSLAPKKANLEKDVMEEYYDENFISMNKLKGPASFFGKKFILKQYSLDSNLETKIYNK